MLGCSSSDALAPPSWKVADLFGGLIRDDPRVERREDRRRGIRRFLRRGPAKRIRVRERVLAEIVWVKVDEPDPRQ